MKLLRLLIPLTFALVIFFTFIAAARSSRKTQEGTPRAQKRQQKWGLLGIVGVLLQNIYFLHISSHLSALVMINVGLLAGVLLWGLYALPLPPREAHARANYKANPSICGRCDYDLTGNTSGTCPECGWQLNDELLPLDDPNWVAWWRGWEIESLENRRKTLVTCIGSTAMLVIAPVVLLWITGWWQVAAIMGLTAVHQAITTLRVLQYGRRQSP